jgi:hypothetical protein|nr:MAG TPA: hypothetical protein [Caudoviricetes sp.]
MSIILNKLETSGKRWGAPSAKYPQGTFINGSGKGMRDGSYAHADWANDLFGAIGAILSAGGQTPNGKVETAEDSQVLTAISEIIRQAVETMSGIPTAVASGTVNAITATFTKKVTLTNGFKVFVRSLGKNTSGDVTFQPTGLAVKPVLKKDGKKLSVGDITGAGFWLDLLYDDALGAWILQNAASGSGYSYRYYGEDLTGNAEIAVADLHPSDNPLIGDHVVDRLGRLFEITAMNAAATAVTVGEQLSNWHGETPDISLIVQMGEPGTAASVEKSGTIETPTFTFTIPKGDKGDRGEGLNPQGAYKTLEELKAAHPTSTDGAAYLVGDRVYAWSATANDYIDAGTIKGEKGDTGASFNEVPLDPDPELYFLKIYGETHGDVIGDLVVQEVPFDPDPVDVLDKVLKE